MRRVFISYRRTDTEEQVRSLGNALIRHFGKEQVFYDKEVIEAGDDWQETVDRTLQGDTIVLAVIGDTWVAGTDAAGNRIIENLKVLKLDDAQRSLDEFQGLFARNQQSFDRASEQRLSVNFQLFWKLAREDRDVQAQLLKLGSDWIRHAKESGDRPSEEMIGVKEKWNAVMKQGNDNLGAMNTKANEIVDELIKQRK